MSHIDEDDNEPSNSGDFLTLHKLKKPDTLLELLKMVDMKKVYFLRTKDGPAVVQFKMDFYEGFFQMITPITYVSTKLRSDSDLSKILDIYELDDLFSAIKSGYSDYDSGMGSRRWR